MHRSFLAALKAMYSSVLSSVRVNDKSSDWFSFDKGVKQGCLLSPALFSIYINDLILEINDLGIGIQCDSRMISTLVYADDIILLAEKELDLQKLLDVVQTWCSKWAISINTQKSNVIHFRKKGKQFPRTDFNFLVGDLSVLLVVCPLVILRGLPGEDLSVLYVVCPLVIPKGLPGEDLSVLLVVCPLVIPRGLPGEDLSVFLVVCPLVVPRGLPGEDLFRLSFTTKCFAVFWDPDTR